MSVLHTSSTSSFSICYEGRDACNAVSNMTFDPTGSHWFAISSDLCSAFVSSSFYNVETTSSWSDLT